MLRKRNILICLAAVTFCCAGTVPAKACGDWDLIDWNADSNGNLWMLWWNWFDWSWLWQYIDPLAGLATQNLVSEDGQVLGRALLYHAEWAQVTYIRVKCWSLAANTEYTVLLCEVDDDGHATNCIELGSFTTDQNGSGYLNVSIDGHKSNWSVVVGIEQDGLFYSFIMQNSYPEGLGVKKFTFDGAHIDDREFQLDSHGYALTTYTFTADRIREE